MESLASSLLLPVMSKVSVKPDPDLLLRSASRYSSFAEFLFVTYEAGVKDLRISSDTYGWEDLIRFCRKRFDDIIREGEEDDVVCELGLASACYVRSMRVNIEADVSFPGEMAWRICSEELCVLKTKSLSRRQRRVVGHDPDVFALSVSWDSVPFLRVRDAPSSSTPQ